MLNGVLEVCVDSYESAEAAVRGGATRLELCSNLVIGGTTPGMHLFQKIKKNFSIPAGFEKAEYSGIDFHGEPYLAATEGRFAFDEDGRPVLELNIYYLEDAIRRRIKIFFKEEEMEVHFSEVPGKKILLDGLESLTAALSEITVVRKIREKGNVDLLRLAMETTLEPVVRGKRIV